LASLAAATLNDDISKKWTNYRRAKLKVYAPCTGFNRISALPAAEIRCENSAAAESGRLVAPFA
jgi:hypothetical protein